MKTAGSAGCRSTAAARTVSDRAGVSWPHDVVSGWFGVFAGQVDRFTSFSLSILH